MSNIGKWHKHRDLQRGGWNVFDSSGDFSCYFDEDWEAQGYCNTRNEKEGINVESQ